MHREPRVLEAEAQMGECLDCRARITSKELAHHSILWEVASPRMLVVQVRERMQLLVKKSSYAHRQVDEQPSKKSKKNGDRSAVAMLKNYTTIGLRIWRYGAAEVFIDLAEELKHAEANPMCSIHQNRGTLC